MDFSPGVYEWEVLLDIIGADGFAQGSKCGGIRIGCPQSFGLLHDIGERGIGGYSAGGKLLNEVSRRGRINLVKRPNDDRDNQYKFPAVVFVHCEEDGVSSP